MANKTPRTGSFLERWLHPDRYESWTTVKATGKIGCLTWLFMLACVYTVFSWFFTAIRLIFY